MIAYALVAVILAQTAAIVAVVRWAWDRAERAQDRHDQQTAALTARIQAPAAAAVAQYQAFTAKQEDSPKPVEIELPVPADLALTGELDHYQLRGDDF